jgi:hypothetical protein
MFGALCEEVGAEYSALQFHVQISSPSRGEVLNQVLHQGARIVWKNNGSYTDQLTLSLKEMW